MLNTMSVTFSMLFVVIAALVIYSTIGRLVEQDSRLVGASKAMGLKNSEVFAKYLIFGVGGTLIGVTAGILTAYFAANMTDKAIMAVNIQGDALMDMTLANARMILDAAEEKEDDDGEDDPS